jgi:peptidoglycan/LPS O-acetylase OafA/YrhL
MTYNKQLDGLRFLAIFGVLIAHWIQWTIPYPLLRNLPYGTGVQLFFVLSGYLITKILLDFRLANARNGVGNANSIKAFYIRRTLRIFPIYYITIFFILFINFDNVRELFPWLVSYTINFKHALGAGEGDLRSFSHFWSLAVEEQFYLFWTFVIVFTPERFLKQIILLFILGSLMLKFYFGAFTSHGTDFSTLTIINMHSLGFGGIIAVISTYYKDAFFKFPSWPLKIALLLLIGIFLVVFDYFAQSGFSFYVLFWSEPLLIFIYGLAIIIVIKNGFKGVVKWFLENPVVVYLGKISYGMYILHLFMAPLYFNFISKYIYIPYSDLGCFIIFFIIMVALSTLSWFAIEKPINNLKRYFGYTSEKVKVTKQSTGTKQSKINSQGY